MTAVGLVLGSWAALGTSPTQAAGGGGCHRDMAHGPTEGTGDVVEMVDFCMSPSVLRVEPGDVVAFVNRDQARHNLFGSGMFGGDLATDSSVAYRFDDDGTYAFACTYHPGMVGAVVVGTGHRTAPADRATVPSEVERATVATTTTTTSTTTLDAVPLSASVRTTDDRAGRPAPVLVPAAALGAAVLVGYAAGRRRRLRRS